MKKIIKSLILEKNYHKTPYFVKVILLNIVGYKNYKKRYTSFFYDKFNKYKKSWYFSEEELYEMQKIALRALLLECFDYSTWYQKQFKKLEISKKDIEENPFDVLKKFPILSKSDRKKNVEEIINRNPRRNKFQKGHTSGTSGTPTISYSDVETIQNGFALWKRFHYTIGLGLHPKTVRLSGRLIVNPKQSRKPFWVYNYFEKQLLMSTYHLKEENANAYIDKLNEFRPELIDGYPSAVYILAKLINQNKIKLTFSPTAIATTAETLYDYQRIEIEKAFKCNVYNQYASSEGSPFITECKKGNLHLNLDSGFFELLNTKNEPAQPGEIARMVVTSFRNYKTPLLRYDIQDTVLLANENETCSCECNMPIIQRIIGREDDIFWTKEKGYVGRLDTAYKGLYGLKLSQLIQETPEKVIINNVVDEEYDEKIKGKLIANLQDRLGVNLEYEFNIVDDIPLGANGKFKAVVRKFKID